MFRLPASLPNTIERWFHVAVCVCLMVTTLAIAPARAQAPEDHDLAHEAWLAIKSRCGACHLRSPEKATAVPIPSLRSLSRLAADRDLIAPGWPDRSALVWRMLDNHDASQSEAHGDQAKSAQNGTTTQTRRVIPTGVSLVRRWIERLTPRKPKAPNGTTEILPSNGADRTESWLRVDVVQNSFSVGEQIVYRIQSERTCRLSLINVDPRGIATVVFPNAYTQTNLVDSDTPLEVPAADDPFVFTAKRHGTEILIALCAEGDGAALGIRHDFGHQRFTVLGDWERFLTTGRPPRPLINRKARRRWRYRRVRRCYRIKRRGRKIRRCRWRRRRAGLIRPKPLGPLPPARLRAVTVVAVEVR